MRALVTVSGARGASEERVLVEADGSAPLEQVLPELAGIVAADLHRGPLAAVVDGRFVPVTDGLDAARLRDGSVITLGPRGEVAAHETRTDDSLVELRIVSGPDAGTVAPAWRGSVVIGSAPDATLRIDDAVRLGPAELVVDIETSDLVTVRAAGAGTTALLDGTAITPDPVAWPLGGQVELAGRLIELATPDLGDAALQPSADGAGLDYNRPPRILPPESETSLRLPAPPPRRRRARCRSSPLSPRSRWRRVRRSSSTATSSCSSPASPRSSWS